MGDRFDRNKGRRVELISTTDEHTDLRPGDQGTVVMEDALGTVHIRWDSGSRLGLVPGEDEFRFLDERERET